jgi:hypothetical protein
MGIRFVRAAAVARAAFLVASTAFCLTASAQPDQPARLAVLVPEKSISLAALKQFEKDLGDASAPIATALEAKESTIAVPIRSGDTLDGILARHWGLASGRDYADSSGLVARILAIPDNDPIRGPGRVAGKLDIRPGDTLYLPSNVFGWSKSGPIVVPLSGDVDPRALARTVFASGPSIAVQTIDNLETVAALSNVELCPDARAVEPFDPAGVARQMKLNERRPPRGAGSNRVIAVIDAGLRGNVQTFAPFIAKPVSANDSYRSEGGVFIPLRRGAIVDLASVTSPPSEHGTHIMTLALGGVSPLARLMPPPLPDGPWRVLPIVVEGVRSTNTGLRIPEIQPPSIAKALSYAQERNPRIVNMSLESQDAEYIAQAMIAESERKLRLYVVAAGNGRLVVDNPSPPPDVVPANDFAHVRHLEYRHRVMPAMLGGPTRAHIVSVAAHDAEFHLTSFTGKYFRNVDIAAPGVCVRSYSTLGDNIAASTVEAYTGSSQSAAIVSYAASLVADALGYELWSPPDIKARLLASSVYDADKYADALSSRGRLSIESAIAVHFDIVRYRKDGKLVEAVGDLDSFEGAAKPFKNLDLCNVGGIRSGDVWKAVASMSGPEPRHARFEYVRRSKVSLVTPAHGDDPLDWTWDKCAANWGNVNRIKFKPVEGPELVIDFKDLAEIVPRHR